MPAQEGIGLDEMEGVSPRGVDAGQQYQEEAVLPEQPRPRRGRPSQHENLLSQECVLGHQFRARSNGVEGGGGGECGRGTSWSEQGLDDLAHSVTATLDGAGHSTDPTVQHPNVLPSRGAGPFDPWDLRGLQADQQALTVCGQRPIVARGRGK